LRLSVNLIETHVMSRFFFPKSSFALILALALLAHPALAAKKQRAADTPATFYHNAFQAVMSGKTDQAEAFAERGPDPVLNKVVRGQAMALPGNDYSFEQLNGFLNANPGWPNLRGVQMIAEQKLPSNWSAAQIVAWFSTHPPVTLAGFNRDIEAMNASGDGATAQNAIRLRWVNGDFSEDDLASFNNKYSGLIDGNTMWARMDRLLWKNDASQARALMPYIGGGDRSLAEARLALGQQDSHADAWVARVPSSLSDDPGLVYQKLKYLVKNNRDDDAVDILLHPPSDLGNAAPWWDQRQIEIRRAMAQRDFNLAYKLAARHGQVEPKTLVQGEFMAGWLALRFLNKPDLAHQHFQVLYDNSSTPITRARGAYWLGRTYEALGDKNAAEQAYEDAAAFNTTYYGQLATTRLYASPVLSAKADPPIPDTVRTKFMARDNIRAILRLNDIGENERARSFFKAATDAADQRAEFILLTEVAAKLRRPDLGIQAVKAAAQDNMLVENGGFPILTMHAPSPPEPAFTHALIRQESMFNPEAESGVGAKGLMQLMPRTAKDTAKKVGVRYSETRLGDPSYNLQLGTAFVQEQIERFNGSYILALAGYNAGPGRVRDWMQQYGDPRDSNTDAIDWIEEIPIQETRNYVQRIIENLQIYRAKLAGGQSRLLIINDLRR
jgi:soluble lytic murein transglycosylase